jgi:alpha-L-arabinofuranosidase
LQRQIFCFFSSEFFMPQIRMPIVAALLVTAVTSTVSLAQEAPAGKLTIQAAEPKFKMSPNLYGLMTEEINHAYQGGLYGELIQNRTFADGAGGGRRGGAPATGASSPAAHWSLQGTGGQMTIDQTEPVTAALARSLKLEITEASEQAPVGIANDGYWGVPVKPESTYTASFYAKAGNGFKGPLTVAIVGNDGKVYASGKAEVTDKWERKVLKLKTGGGFEATAAGKFVITGAAKGTVNFSLVSLFPPVYKERTGEALGKRPVTGFRPDVMELLADMKPTYLRFPGGNYVEGPNLEARFNFKTMIGPWEERPGHAGSWGYRSDDGMGLLEFLEWCEDLKMEPVLAVWAGLNLNGGRGVVTGDALKPYIQDALDEIEYVAGDANTSEWAKKRAADGHKEPFKLQYVEIGNEDNLNGGQQTYQGQTGRFALFYQAIKAKYPKLQVIATTNPGQGVVHDVIDIHNYMNEGEAIRNAHKFDNYSRTGPKVFEGEWATQEGGLNNNSRPSTPTFTCALSDAAFMTGLERNSDIVIMQCYAPLFVNMNPGGTNWKTDLIGYDAVKSFGSPSYWAQVMFANNKGDEVLAYSDLAPQTIPPAPAAAAAPAGGRRGGGQGAPANEPLFVSTTKDDATGEIILKMVNVREVDQKMEVTIAGVPTILKNASGWEMTGNVNEGNSLAEPKHIAPKVLTITDASAKWTHTFPGHSITVVRFKTK